MPLDTEELADSPSNFLVEAPAPVNLVLSRIATPPCPMELSLPRPKALPLKRRLGPFDERVNMLALKCP
jgi:hypothetical protein